MSTEVLSIFLMQEINLWHIIFSFNANFYEVVKRFTLLFLLLFLVILEKSKINGFSCIFIIDLFYILMN